MVSKNRIIFLSPKDKTTDSTDPFHTKTQGYGSLLACGAWRYPHTVLEAMRLESIRPDTVSINTAICGARRWPVALQLLESLEEETQDPEVATCQEVFVLGVGKSEFAVFVLSFSSAAIQCSMF